MRECRCKAVKQMQRKLMLAKVPEEFRSSSIQSFDLSVYETEAGRQRASLAKRAAANYVKNFPTFRTEGKGLYLYSYVKGSGKTKLAVSIANALAKCYDRPETPLTLLFTSTVDLLEEIKRTFTPDSKVQSAEMVRQFQVTDVLVLDDIGVENVTPWAEQIFTNVLEHRLTSRKVTIFTSNLAVEELDQKYKGGRVSSRIEKMAFPVYMPDESIRSVLAKKENEQLQQWLYE